MKKILLLTCVLSAFSTFAQKDVSATMVSPAEGTTIQPGQSFDATFTVTNTGTTALEITDSVYLSIDLAGGNIFGQYIYWATTTNTALAPGASYDYTFEDIVFNTIPANAEGAQDICAVLYLYEGTAADATTEPDMDNNVDCNSVNLVAGTVGLNELAGFNEGISFFPNPATAVVTFSTEGSTASHANIYSLSGALVASVKLNAEGTTTYTVSDLLSGMYIVNFDGNGTTVKTAKLAVK